MTRKARFDGRSSVSQPDTRTEPQGNPPDTSVDSPTRSIYSVVVVALVIIGVFGLLSSSTMSRAVSSSAQQLRDTQSAHEALLQAQEAVSLATLSALDRDAGVASDNAVDSAVSEARIRMAAFDVAMGRLDGSVEARSRFVLSANTVLRHIESGSAPTAQVFLTTKLQDLNNTLNDELDVRHGAAVQGMLDAEASAERTTELAQTLLSLATVAGALVVLLLRSRNDSTETPEQAAPVSHLRQVS